MRNQNNSNSKAQVVNCMFWNLRDQNDNTAKVRGTTMHYGLQNIVTDGFQKFQYHGAKHPQYKQFKNQNDNTHPLDVFSWVHQWPVLKTMTSASWYIEVVRSIKSNLNVSSVPFLPLKDDSLTRNGELTKSTEQL